MKLKMLITVIYAVCLTIAAAYLMFPGNSSEGIKIAAMGESPN